MSTYYIYYMGYKLDDKIHFAGPYDKDGDPYPAVERSRSFASDLYDEFWPLPIERAGESLISKFLYKDDDGSEIWGNVKCLPLTDLPKFNRIIEGYFLIEDVEEYRKTRDASNLDYNPLDPIIYNAKLVNELQLGKPDPDSDQRSASEYMFYAYQPRFGQDAEIATIYDTYSMIADDIPDNAQPYVILHIC